jgi:hypothetical protein
VHVAGNFSADAWLRGLNAGRSFVTTGPLLFATLDGKDPGHRFEQAEPDAREYTLGGQAISAAPLDRIEVIVNGELARAIAPANRQTGQGAVESPLDATIRVDGSSWVAIRCFESRPDRRVRFAHTGPFYVDVAGRPLRPRKEEVEYLIWRVEAQIERSERVLPAPALDEYRAALGVYRAIAATAR